MFLYFSLHMWRWRVEIDHCWRCSKVRIGSNPHVATYQTITSKLIHIAEVRWLSIFLEPAVRWVRAFPMGMLKVKINSNMVNKSKKWLLMWPILSFWQVVWGFHLTWALPLERFKSESFMISPPCLGSNLFKHLIVVCPCTRIACALMPWFKQFEHPNIRSVEDCFFGLPACHLLI